MSRCNTDLQNTILKQTNTFFKQFSRENLLFFFAYRNERHFYTKNRSESSIFLHHFIPFPWRWLSKDTYFFLQFFINPFGPNFTTYIDMQKIVCTTRYKSLFFSFICLINSGYALVKQSAHSWKKVWLSLLVVQITIMHLYCFTEV
jgi:hypothetical protein